MPLKLPGRSSAGASVPPQTLQQWLLDTQKRFRSARLAYGHGTHNALDEAAWLLLHVMRLPHEDLEASLNRHLTDAEKRRARILIDKRINDRLPLAYLLKEAWLGKNRFFVDRRVIVPRSYLAESLHAGMHPWITDSSSVKRALDLCTGSGCLAVLMAKTFAGARVDAVDLSAAALAVAKRNVSTFRLSDRVRLLKSDLFEGIGQARYDLILSNPPYVTSRVMSSLPPEYRAEPALALAGGSDGLDLVRRILQKAPGHLLASGLLAMEIGHNRSALERSFPHVPFTWVATSGGEDCVFVLRREELQSLEKDGQRFHSKDRGI